MSQPAARVTDNHTCPQPSHIGGPVLPPGCPTVIVGGMNAARLGDALQCTGAVDTITQGAATVLLGGAPAARLGDGTAHGGILVTGEATVLIGGATVGAPGPGPEEEDKDTEQAEKKEESASEPEGKSEKPAPTEEDYERSQEIRKELDDLQKEQGELDDAYQRGEISTEEWERQNTELDAKILDKMDEAREWDESFDWTKIDYEADGETPRFETPSLETPTDPTLPDHESGPWDDGRLEPPHPLLDPLKWLEMIGGVALKAAKLAWTVAKIALELLKKTAIAAAAHEALKRLKEWAKETAIPWVKGKWEKLKDWWRGD